MKMVRDAGLDEKVYILAGVTSVKSDKALKYMQTVPGMKVPDELIKRMAGAEDKKAEGVKITVEMIQAIKEIKGVAGVHVGVGSAGDCREGGAAAEAEGGVGRVVVKVSQRAGEDRPSPALLAVPATTAPDLQYPP
jgi:hypothetical protein